MSSICCTPAAISRVRAARGPLRLETAQRYSYVQPTERLLTVLARHAPIVEIGAGTGYWAHLLRQRGVDIVAYDLAPAGAAVANRYHGVAPAWSEVLGGGLPALRIHADRALFTCWPPLFSALGEVLAHYRGDTVLSIGDGGPRTSRIVGLAEDFDEVERYPVVAFDPDPAHPARLTVWRRKDEGVQLPR